MSVKFLDIAAWTAGMTYVVGYYLFTDKVINSDVFGLVNIVCGIVYSSYGFTKKAYASTAINIFVVVVGLKALVLI